MCLFGSCLTSWAANVVYPEFVDLIVGCLGIEVVFLTVSTLVAVKMPLSPLLGLTIVLLAGGGASAYGLVSIVLMTTHVGESGYSLSFVITSGLGGCCCLLGTNIFEHARRRCWKRFRGKA